MILSIAWKNVWRNKTRSLVVIVAVTLGLYGAVFGAALMMGMMEKVDDSIQNEVSHIQIHHPEFRDNLKPEFSITNTNELLTEINKHPKVVSSCSRIKTLGMGSNSYSSIGVMINAIDPIKEKEVTKLYTTLIDSAGTYFEEDWNNAILISSRVAKKLKIVQFKITDQTLSILKKNKVPKEVLTKLEPIKGENFRKEKKFLEKLEELLGKDDLEKYESALIYNTISYKIRSKVVFRFQDVNGETVNEAFKVVGVFKTNNSMFDEMNVFVKKDYFTKLTGFDEKTSHEIAILLENDKTIDEDTETIAALCPDMETVNFFDLDPMLVVMVKFSFLYYYIIIIIILFALGFGIVNTMLMAVLERVKELGMLMAIGMNKARIFFMIILESIFLSIIGGIFGMFLGGFTSWRVGISGWDMSAYAEGFEAVGYSSVMYPKISWEFLIGTTILVILTGVISAIYPARKALKLNPADAIRSDA